MPVLQHRWVDTGAVRLYLVDWGGAGDTVVCLHGLTANAMSFCRLAEVLVPRFHVYSYDLRGRGDSDKPLAGYGLEAHRADLLAVIDHLGAAPVSLVGHSFGALVCVYFAALHPELVRQLVLLDAGANLPASVLESIKPSLQRLETEYSGADEFLARIRAAPFLQPWTRYMEEYYLSDLQCLPGGRVRSKVPARVVQEEIREIQAYDMDDYLPRVSCPTLVVRAGRGILAADDHIFPAQDARHVATTIPRARLLEVSAANHYTLVLAPQPELEATLASFLGGGAARGERT